MGARKRAGKGDRKPDGGSAGGPKAGNAGGIGAVGLALLVAGGAVAVWWVVGGSGGGSGGGGGGGDVGLFSRTRSEEMDRVDRLRTMVSQPVHPTASRVLRTPRCPSSSAWAPTRSTRWSHAQVQHENEKPSPWVPGFWFVNHDV